jgi:NAD(P)-dependent dehydrogenase (short-subunit alcohol dehydrogenase family)
VTTRLDGMVALVAGAGPGIGRACAAALGAAGAELMVAARHRDRLDILAGELEAETGRTVVPHHLDLADPASCRSLAEDLLDRFGRIDVLVNVATFGGDHELVEEADWESWRHAFEVNVVGTMELSRAAGRAMRAAGGGSIIQIGTQGTHALPSGRARYTATKAAMVSASLTLAKELGPWGVRVNVVTPGLTTGAPLDALIAAQAERRGITAEEASRQLAASAALQRHVEPADVADAVLFLAGPGARAITGVELPVTAGR